MKNPRCMIMTSRVGVAIVWVAGVLCAGISTAAESAPRAKTVPIEMTLDECLEMALEQNRTRPASRFAVAAAEAQHQQALSAYWPHMSLKGAYELMDEPQNYIFPSSTFSVPSMTMGIPAQNISIEMPVPGQNFSAPVASVSVPAQSFTVPAQSMTIPDQEIKLMDEESWYASLEAQWLLWDGGMRKGLREQSQAGIEVARQQARRTDLILMDDVTRLYYGAVMARQIHKLGRDTLARMGATLNLTERMYQEGSGTVKKTDYLENKVAVETLRSAVAMLENNQDLAEAALAFTIGLEWYESVRPVATEIPFEPLPADLDAMVGEAYEFSPDWKSLEAALDARAGALREAKSGYYPKIAVSGNLHKWWNDYDKGMATEENKEGWTVRVGAELPLFQGFLTRNKVKEARARLNQMKEKRILLQEGIGLQVRRIFMGLDAAGKRYQATLDAMNTSTENRDLNTRAYQNDLVETDDVIKAQLMEALMSAQHYKMCFDHIELRSKLNLVVGTEVTETLGLE